jgi:hypothetical protein
VWDLVKNFSLPAIVIDRASLHEIPKRLRMVKKNVPGALVGILGIDLFGSVIVEMFGVIILPGMFAGGLLGHYGQGFLPGNWLVTLPDSDFTINILPMFFMGLLCSILVSFLNSLVHLVKTSYFTIFYVSLSRPNDIQPALRKEVSHYLNHNDRLEGYDVFR